jgi:hypothetical protein
MFRHFRVQSVFTGAIIAILATFFTTSDIHGQTVDFTRDIRPILSNHCFKCHGPDANTREAELRLDTKKGTFSIADGKKIVSPGKPSNSELFRRISTKDADEQMPPKSEKVQLTPKQIGLLKQWIAQGAKWDEHWAFQTPRRPKLPAVRNRGRVRNSIDTFIIARLEKEQLGLSPVAKKETLIRRVTLDLTGLPPTIAEIDAFLNDKSPNAYGKVVDRLLASPAYGERMAWDWLDASRYADSNGFQGDPERTMWPWRDWLVNALNDNKPFNQFTIEMLAGDLLPNATPSQIIATGFNRNHMINGEGGRIAEETRVENVFDRTETTATVWLGLTMTCARCHDHKFDPYTQREYYGLYAFFNNTSEDGRGRSGSARPAVSFLPPDARRLITILEPQIQKLSAKLSSLEKQQSPRFDSKPPQGVKKNDKLWNSIRAILKKKPEQRDAKSLLTLANYFQKSHATYASTLRQLRTLQVNRDSARKKAVRVMIMDEQKKRRETFVLTRGTYNKPTAKVTQGTPAFLPSMPKNALRNRLAFAKWLVDPNHPLMARVIVNRFWQQFFRMGIVKSTEDFGAQGEKPSHPKLLDWLATEFVRSGWDVKHLHRLIVTSATYRQSSKLKNGQTPRNRPGQTLPGNIRLLSRFPRYRMPSWMLRDQALAVSGLHVSKFGGPPVKPYQPPGVWAEATFGKKRYVQDHGDKLYRRSMYIFWRRIVGPTIFFDSAARQACEVNPSLTNTPLHALTLLNETTYIEAARMFAERVMKLVKTPKDRFDMAFRMAVARKASAAEIAILQNRLNILRKKFTADPKAAAALLKVGEFPRDGSLNLTEHAAYTALFSMILNLDEFISRE